MKNMMNVKPKYLLLIAGIVWFLAGTNIFIIGITSFISSWNNNILYLFPSFVVMFIFTKLIFYPLVQKHHNRITNLEEDKPFYHFFDKKSYIIMICMMTVGITLRQLKILPSIVIGMLYIGIGFSLIIAGLLFIIKFIKEQNKEDKA